MSIETYEKQQFENEIYPKLIEAELEAKSNTKRISHEKVMEVLKERISGGENS